jgi:GxxExxY protein
LVFAGCAYAVDRTISGPALFGDFGDGTPDALRGGMLTDPRAALNDPETYAIFGAAIVVHRKMGRGFLEPVYRACLAIELRRQDIPFEREVSLRVAYDGITLPLSFRTDFVCFGSIVVEVKALPELRSRDTAQLMNYLKASGLHRGVLLNFGSGVLGKQRVVWNLPIESDPLGRGPSYNAREDR